MPITEEQRKQRKARLGSTDIAAILGVDHFKTAYDVYLEKTGKLEDEKKVEEYKTAGNMFEDGILTYAEQQLGKLVRNQFRAAEGLPIGSNIDAIVIEPLDGVALENDPVDAKTAGLYGPLVEEWGEEGTDQVPDRILIQGHVHMLCTEANVCHIPTFLGGRGFKMFRINRDAEVIDLIKKSAIEFWNKHVLADVPPEDVLPNLELIKRIRRVPESVVDVPSEIIAAWLESKDALNIAKKIKEEAERMLLTTLGTAEGGNSSLGTLTYLSQTRKGYTVKESNYRALRFKKKKETKNEQ